MSNLKDELEESLKVMRSYHFPINRAEQSVYQYLQQFYSDYLRGMETVPLLTKQDRKTIRNTCNRILETIDLYNKNNIQKSYAVLFSMMNRIQSHLWRSYLGDTFSMDNGYYRVQKSGLKCDDLKIGLLHCPFSKRQWISTARFSLPGVPSTYMSTMPELAWYESRMPAEYYIARYYINPDMYHKYSLLYLDYNLQFWTRKWSQAINHDKDLAEVHKKINDLLHTIPLVAACSFVTSTENCSFREEYIIPQMLMSWIKQNTDMIGILFSSSSPYDETGSFFARNIVMPGNDFDDKGYCKRLQQIFIHENSPQFTKKSISVSMERTDEDLQRLRVFIKEIQCKTSEQQDHVIPLYHMIEHFCIVIELCCENMQHTNEMFLYREQPLFDVVRRLIADMFGLYATTFNRDKSVLEGLEMIMNITPQLAEESIKIIKQLLSVLQKLQVSISKAQYGLFNDFSNM